MRLRIPKNCLALGILSALSASLPLQGIAQQQDKAQGKPATETSLRAQISKLKSDCRPDLEKYCKGVTPGEGRLAACLDSRGDQLSPLCKSSWTSTKANISQKLEQEELVFRDSCGSDVQKFCSKVPSGRGRLLDCISRHKDEVSSSCQKYQASLDQRISNLVG